MEIEMMLIMLRGKATRENFSALEELERISEQSGVLYPYIMDFIEMTGSDQYGIRVRGFRLLCKHARWDEKLIIDENLDAALGILHDEKPTVVRQALAALHSLVPYKKNLYASIRERVQAIDCFRYQDSMQGLILQDIQKLLSALEA